MNEHLIPTRAAMIEKRHRLSRRADPRPRSLGTYALQAAIAACHVRARMSAETDCARIAALYDALARVSPSPVVELNRAVAHGIAFGPGAALALVDVLIEEGSLQSYYLLPSVRGDLLVKLGLFAQTRGV
jgi:predicted RNA polymerase sigma factor